MYGLVIRRILIIMVPIVPSLPKEFLHISGTREAYENFTFGVTGIL